MKGVIFTIILILFGGIFVGTNAQTTRRGDTSVLFEIRNGQTKNIPGSKAKIKFLSVVEDSRCPEGTNCIWAGNAQVKLRVTDGGKTRVFDLNTGKGSDSYNFGRYQIKLVKVSPTPTVGNHIRQKDYTITLNAIPSRPTGKA